MTQKTSKSVRKLQDAFFHDCVNGNETLEDVMKNHHIPPQTLSGWLIDRDFRVRLHGLRRFLRKARDLQLELGARQAADVLTRCATDTSIKKVEALQRSACVDLIRLARDSRARASATNPSVDELTKHRALYHPDVHEDEARLLMAALIESDGTKADPNAPAAG